MLIHFWGTRGSLPAPLNYLAVRTKIARRYWRHVI